MSQTDTPDYQPFESQAALMACLTRLSALGVVWPADRDNLVRYIFSLQTRARCAEGALTRLVADMRGEGNPYRTAED